MMGLQMKKVLFINVDVHSVLLHEISIFVLYIIPFHTHLKVNEHCFQGLNLVI